MAKSKVALLPADSVGWDIPQEMLHEILIRIRDAAIIRRGPVQGSVASDLERDLVFPANYKCIAGVRMHIRHRIDMMKISVIQVICFKR